MAFRVVQQLPNAGRRLQRHLLIQGAAVGAGVHGHHPVAAQGGEGSSQCRGDRGFADATLQRHHRDPVATPQRPVYPGHQVVVPRGPGTLAQIDQLTGQRVEQPAPAVRWRWFDLTQQHAGGQFGIRRVRDELGAVRGVHGPHGRVGRAAVIVPEARRVDPRDAGHRSGLPRWHPGGCRWRRRSPGIGRGPALLGAEAGEGPSRRFSAGFCARFTGVRRGRQLVGRMVDGVAALQRLGRVWASWAGCRIVGHVYSPLL